MKILDLYEITSNLGGRDYLFSQLEMGTTLASRIRAAVDFTRGKMVVALPEGADLSNLPKFRETGLIRWRRRGFATLAHLVRGFLVINRATVLVQDTIASPGEDWLRDYEYREHVASYNQEVYWRLADTALGEEDILGLLYSATFHPWSGFFYVHRQPRQSSELTDIDLDEIVRTLTGVAVGAFDQESFLLWWSDRIPLPIDIKSP